MHPRPKERVVSTSSTGLTGSTGSNGTTRPDPSTPISQIEVLYNTAVQSFVRRDHVKTQAVLSRLLSLLDDQQNQNNARGKAKSTAWYDLDLDGVVDGEEVEQVDVDEWMIKTLKLSISSPTSLYTDPPTKTTTLPKEITNLLPPTTPDKLLDHLLQLCKEHLSVDILPPQIISTLLLASLKLRPSPPSLDFAHRLSEDWLTALPDQFIAAISPQIGNRVKDVKKTKRVEGAREGYMKVVELFVGEVLSREGEFEMARGFLDGENILGSKRKEALYKHLRTVQTTPQNQIPTPSPSSSLVLPSSSSSRSRSGSSSTTSSSSSERTARPNHVQQLGLQSQNIPILSRDKGKGKIEAKELEDVTGMDKDKVTSSGPGSGSKSSKLKNNPASESSTSRSKLSEERDTAINSRIHQLILSIFPSSISQRLDSLLGNNLSYFLSIPIPLIIILTLIIRLRRRNQRRNMNSSLSPTTQNGLVDVRTRLRLARIRQRGWWGWVMHYLNWWINKFGGVWKLGTTITYL
ncbi:hypothetical protein I203_104433 [Kwoniella mangroviensis CBS 8507]|uniref:uncharacterized protein n=1 Tax=Kwoniella mangroviensis CBS 8507 TaxID=1296122 RepID=UPI00080D7898|nr:uncharacterized protein I203_00620 [Kwoniella mangroviensis CBS 8507]OCF70485.1 hypothetical protein I203_00620 [Kwoniella mangroviensis CBS 8507]